MPWLKFGSSDEALPARIFRHNHQFLNNRLTSINYFDNKDRSDSPDEALMSRKTCRARLARCSCSSSSPASLSSAGAAWTQAGRIWIGRKTGSISWQPGGSCARPLWRSSSRSSTDSFCSSEGGLSMCGRLAAGTSRKSGRRCCISVTSPSWSSWTVCSPGVASSEESGESRVTWTGRWSLKPGRYCSASEPASQSLIFHLKLMVN